MSDSPAVGFQITSDPDTTSVQVSSGGARVREHGGAFRLVLVADLDPQATVEDWSEGERTWSVDANTFADRMREHGPRLEVSVPDHLGSAERRTVAWTADTLEAVSPSGIVARVPALAAMAEARDALHGAGAGRLSLDALRERLRSSGLEAADTLADAVRTRDTPSSGTPASDDDGSLDALLGLVDLGDGRPAAGKPGGALGALIDAASEPAGDLDRDAAARTATALADRLRAQVAAVVEHPDVRRAEAAWRGLRQLVGRLAFQDGAALTVLAAPKAALAEAVHYQVLLPEHAEGEQRVPLAAIVADHAAEATSADLELLGDLAGTGESLQVPVVMSAAPAFFGLDAPTDFARLPPATALLQQPEYAAFRSLRQRPEANHLVLAVPSFVLRHAYGPEHPDAEHGVEGGDRLWGHASLLVAMAMAEAHRSRGWPTASAGQPVPDLPVRTTRMGAMPLAASFSDSILDDLARAGVLALSGPLQRDHAVLGPPATVAVPADASADARARASLPGAVMAALASHRALLVGPACAGMSPEDAREEIEQRFRAFFGGGETLDEEAVTVQYLDEHTTDTAYTFGVRLRPPREALPHPVGVVFGVEVPRAAPEDGG